MSLGLTDEIITSHYFIGTELGNRVPCLLPHVTLNIGCLIVTLKQKVDLE